MKKSAIISAFILLTASISYGHWSGTSLSAAKAYMGATALGSKAHFAGGVDFFSSGNVYATVDIFDTLTQQCSVAELSAARLNITAFSYGNKVLFAGGANPQIQAYYNVDIYNAETDT
jgi:hypothetical protein